MPFFTYIARCSDQTLYVGYCSNIPARELKHNCGTGSAYTGKRLPLKIIYFETFPTKLEAIRRERQLKGWSRLKKENLIKYGHPTKCTSDQPNNKQH